MSEWVGGSISSIFLSRKEKKREWLREGKIESRGPVASNSPRAPAKEDHGIIGGEMNRLVSTRPCWISKSMAFPPPSLPPSIPLTN